MTESNRWLMWVLMVLIVITVVLCTIFEIIEIRKPRTEVPEAFTSEILYRGGFYILTLEGWRPTGEYCVIDMVDGFVKLREYRDGDFWSNEFWIETNKVKIHCALSIRTDTIHVYYYRNDGWSDTTLFIGN